MNSTIKEVTDKIDWSLLREQIGTLTTLSEIPFGTDISDHLIGILELLESLEDGHINETNFVMK